MPAGSPGGGQFAKGGGSGGGGSSAKSDTKVLTEPSGNEANAGGSQAKDKKGKVKPKLTDFEKDKVDLGRFKAEKATADKFLEVWESKVGDAPAEFKRDFLGGVNSTMSIDASADGRRWSIKGSVLDSNGQAIGTYERTIDWDRKTATSDYFALNRNATGGDVGKRLLAGNVESYQRMGIEQVKVHANIDVGGYAWAKYGYVPTQQTWASLSSDVLRRLDADAPRGSGSGSGYTPESWDEIGDDERDRIKDAWMSATREEFVQSEISNWRDNGDALDDAKYQLAGNFSGTTDDTWAADAVDEYLGEKEEAGEPVPYTAKQLLAAISVDYEAGWSGQKDPTIEFDDAKLKEPSNAPDPSQMNLPGFKPSDPSAQLTEDMRDELTDKLTKAFNDKAEENAEDLEPPEHIVENVDEYQADYWESMSDRDKYRWAEREGELREIEIEDEEEDVEPVEVEDDAEADALKKLAKSRDPKAVWAIADSPQGKGLLLGSDWWGTLDLKDKETMDRFHAYVGKPKKPAAAA